MQVADLSKPGEKKKLIVAGVLGLLAILFLWWTFVGFGSTPSKAETRPSPSPTPRRSTVVDRGETTARGNDPSIFQAVRYEPLVYNAPEAQRNIFAYYEKPPEVKVTQQVTPTPTPTPPPPILLASLSPSNVYARTADFTLELSGDRFTSDVRIYVDQRELPTKFKGPQQLSTTIPASMIANPGPRNIIVQTPNKSAYSNPLSFNVTAPPVPNYSYIGLLSSQTRVDVAYLQDKGSKDVLTVQRGDVMGGRFRVTSISDKEVVFVDTSLKIRHSVARTEGEKTAGSPLMRPTPRVDAEDDEP
jgi:hypothetical protein